MNNNYSTKKEKERQLNAYSLKNKDGPQFDKVVLDFLKFDCTNFEMLKLEVEKLSSNQKYMGIIFAQIFNLIMNMMMYSRTGKYVVYDRATIFLSNISNLSSYPAPDKFTVDPLRAKLPVRNMEIFLNALGARNYLYYILPLNIQAQEFWLTSMTKMPQYEKYFNPIDGLFVAEAKMYAKDLNFLLEKASLTLATNTEKELIGSSIEMKKSLKI